MRWPAFTLFPPLYDARTAVRVAQWAFVVSLGFAALIIALIDASALMTMGSALSLVLVVAATATVMAPRADLTPATALFYVVPILDALAVVALRVDMPEQTAGALLALVVPAAWLGTSGRIVGIALTASLSTLAVVPDIVSMVSGTSAASAGNVSFAVMVPLGIITVSLFTFGLVDEADKATSAESSARQLRDAIVETVDVGILVLDASGEVILANRVIREHPIVSAMGNADTASLRGLQAFESDGETAYAPGDGPVLRAMQGTDSADELFWVREADGTPHGFVSSSKRLLDGQGSVVATIVVVNEVTQLLDAVQARDRLISTVSHELRTPLTVMKGFLELAREELDDQRGPVAQNLDVVDRHLEREHAIIEQFILAADSFTSQLNLEPVELDLALLAHDVVRESRKAATREADAIRIVGEHVPCRVDALLMSRAIDALLSNALDATIDSGRVTVAVSAPQPGRVTLAVEDSGIGIADIDNRRLFEPFFRTERAHLDAARGVGLGLHMVKRIVEAHGGTIEVSSAAGLGTTVTIDLPDGAPQTNDVANPGDLDDAKQSGDGGI